MLPFLLLGSSVVVALFASASRNVCFRLWQVSRGKASATPASAAGPSRLHALNRGALRRSSNGLFDARL